MELLRYLDIAWRRLWVIVLVTVLVAAATYYFTLRQTPVYQASAVVEVAYGADPRSDPTTAQQRSEQSARSYIEQFKSPLLAQQVSSDLGGVVPPAQVLEMVRAQQVPNSPLIRVTAEGSDPELVAALANKVAEVFIAQTEAKQQDRYRSAKQSLDAQIADLERQINDTQKALAALGDPQATRGSALPDYASVERSRLQTTLASYQTRYAVLLQSAEDFRMAAARYSDVMSVFATAQAPRNPVRPNLRQNMLAGLAFGLILGAGGAFLLEYLDDTVKDPEQLSALLGLTSLGAISRVRHVDDQSKALITALDRRSPVAEAYRVLRTNFQFSGLSGPSTSVVVTSALPQEGKSTTVANLGIVLAQAGKRTILVDADLRRPMLHKLFKLEHEPGLTGLLLNPEIELERALVPTEVEGLRVLPCGPVPPNPAEVLGSPRMAQLIETLEGHADFVLYDSPPVLSATDATVLSAATGNVLLVASHGQTRTGAIVQAREALARASARILGVVLNKVAERRRGYYYYHRYY